MADNYRVVAQRWMTTVNAANQFVKQVEITAVTPGGTTFTVDVPKAQYTAEYVKQVLDAEAAEIMAVESL